MSKTLSGQLLIVDLKRAVASIYFGNATDWQKVRFADPTSKYFPGGPPAVEAFGPVLNQRQRFKQDNMNLRGAEIRDSVTIGEIYAGIKANYLSNNWTLV